jgi:non-canonical poly(A) RNA polymerase PAPD5/7
MKAKPERKTTGSGEWTSFGTQPVNVLAHPVIKPLVGTDALDFSMDGQRLNATSFLHLARVDRVSQEVLPNSNAWLFGSQATGLALLDSDIDIVIIGPDLVDAEEKERVSKVEMQINLRKIAHRLKLREGCKEPGQVRVENMVMFARVPIIKCCNKAGRKCDISYGVLGGLGVLRLVTEKMNQYPTLRPMLLVVKQMLRSRNLNDLSSGGLSSYGLFHMILAVISTTGSMVVRENGLGGLLMHILDFYGRKFDPSQMIVKATGVEPAHTKVDKLRVMDMVDSSTEVVKGCTKHKEIIDVFNSAAQVLTCGKCIHITHVLVFKAHLTGHNIQIALMS